MTKDEVLVCIFNYRHDDNAKRWVKLLNNNFTVKVLDSGNDHIEDEFIRFDNIYYSGLINEAKKLATEKPYKYIGIICSDVEIEDKYVNVLIEKVNNLENEKIGIWQPGLTKQSKHTWAYKKCLDEDKTRFIVSFIDGFCYFVCAELFTNELPPIDTSVNLYGYGIDLYLSLKSNEKDFINVIDTGVRVYHPEGTGYDDAIAHQQGDAYMTSMTGKNLMDFISQYKINRIEKNTGDIKDLFNIVWYVLCWNEMPILPFMIDYWKRIARKVVLYDNNSTDGTLDYLKAFDWIEVRPYPKSTDDTLNDRINYEIKNECWKEQKDKCVDFVLVTDLDEILWANNLASKLQFFKDNEVAVVRPQAYDFVSCEFPVHDGTLLHEQIRTCYRFPWWDKCILFAPDLVDEIGYTEGAHACKPKVKTFMWNSLDTFLFHFKYLSLEYLILKRYATRSRISEENIKNKWGTEYTYNKDQITEQFYERWTYAKKNDIMKVLGPK
jgi:hypothetical protein